MLKVSDLMSSELFTISESATLEEASFQLSAELMSGAPVHDADGAIVGIVSKTDIVRVKGPKGMTKVNEVMHKDIWTVTADMAAREAASLMADKGTHRTLVADSDGKPVGMLTAMDLVRAIADGKSFD